MSDTPQSDSSTDDDPLAGAAVGETRTIEHEQTVHMVDVVPWDYVGRDRDYEVTVTDVEIVPDEHDDAFEDVRVEYEVTATKLLPPDWDQCDEPRTAAERRRSQLRRWLQRFGKVATVGIPAVVSVVLAALVTNRVFREITINGDPVNSPSVEVLVGYLLFLVGFVLFLSWAMSGGLPAMRVNHR